LEKDNWTLLLEQFSKVIMQLLWFWFYFGVRLAELSNWTLKTGLMILVQGFAFAFFISL